MSLYYEAASLLSSSSSSSSSSKPEQQRESRQHSLASTSLKNSIYDSSAAAVAGRKSKPAQLYALVIQAAKWSPVLAPIIDASGLLGSEHKLSPEAALALVHDLLLSKTGIAAPKDHVLRKAVERHKTRLHAEFTRARIKAGHASTAAWKLELEPALSTRSINTAHAARPGPRPRWVRINTIKSDLASELATTFAGFGTSEDLAQVRPAGRVLALDCHVPDVLAVPRNDELIKSPAYLHGKLILQDKASCFPAYLLDPEPGDGDFIDACAAPGNKTTHLAALITKSARNSAQTIYACEKDASRSRTLERMVRRAVGDFLPVVCLASQDFSRLDPADSRFAHVGALLLDPSCSGSGIVGRDADDGQDLQVVLPKGRSKRNKPKDEADKVGETTGGNAADADDTAQEQEVRGDQGDTAAYAARLNALAAFQTALLTHAFAFPAARKVVYSTCSVHATENEGVVAAALASDVARRRGWRVSRRGEQPAGLRAWPVRGDAAAFAAAGHAAAAELADACLRCERGTAAATMGFFAVKFVRDGATSTASAAAHDDEEEWAGLGDDDNDV